MSSNERSMVCVLGIQTAILSGQSIWSYEGIVHLHFLPRLRCDLIFPVATANPAGHLCTPGVEVTEHSVAYRWWTNLYFCCYFPFIRFKSDVLCASLYWQTWIITSNPKSTPPLLLTVISAWIGLVLPDLLFFLAMFFFMLSSCTRHVLVQLDLVAGYHEAKSRFWQSQSLSGDEYVSKDYVHSGCWQNSVCGVIGLHSVS